MSGTTQRHWKHGILREPGVTQPRINLTFRYIIPSLAGLSKTLAGYPTGPGRPG